MITFQQFFSALNRKRVRYLVVGGIAVNLYGIERATGDIDIAVDLEDKNVRKFIEAIKELGLKPRIPVKLEDFADKQMREKWLKEKGMVVFSIMDPKTPFFLLDVFTEVPFDFRKAYQECEKMKSGTAVIPVASIRQLIELKEKTERPQDKADIFYLKKILKEWKHEA